MYWHMNHTICVQILVFHVPSVINVHRVIDVIGVGASLAGLVWPDLFFGDFIKFIIKIAYALKQTPSPSVDPQVLTYVLFPHVNASY